MFQDNPFGRGEPHLRFYAGAPLIHGGLHAGSLWRTLTAEQVERLAG